MVLLPEKKNGATGLKLGMHIQLDSGSNMGVGHTSSSWCIRLKWYLKKNNKKNNLDLGSYIHELIYLGSVSPGEHFKNVYKAIPLLCSCQAKKKK